MPDLEATAAYDRWRRAATEGRDTDARIAAMEVLVRVLGGDEPEWTSAERTAFEGWCWARTQREELAAMRGRLAEIEREVKRG